MKKAMLVIILVGAMMLLSSCSGKSAAPAPAASTSPVASTSRSTNPRTSEVTVTGKWELVGKEGDWKGTKDMVGMDGSLWSVEADGSLYKTDPATGNFTEVGEKGSFHNLKMIEGLDHALWTVEDGTLYKNDPGTGKWVKFGEGGEWSRTVAMVGMNGILYSIEPDGSLWKTDKDGKDTLIDKGGFKGASHLAAMDGKLWTIEEGNLYKTDPATLKWEQVGKEGEWANVTAMQGADKFLWIIDSSGTLYKVDQNGASTVLGERGSYGQTTILTTVNGKLWTVEGGNLYKTS